jgi:hypothetical protein
MKADTHTDNPRGAQFLNLQAESSEIRKRLAEIEKELEEGSEARSLPAPVQPENQP